MWSFWKKNCLSSAEKFSLDNAVKTILELIEY